MYESEKVDPTAGGLGSAAGRAAAERGAGADVRPRRRAVPPAVRNRARGPRPVRPVAVPVPVRPLPGERPVRPGRSGPSSRVPSSRERVLVRRPVVVVARVGAPARGAVAGLALAVLTAAVVVGLGLLGTLAGEWRGGAVPAGGASVEVTVGARETVWDVAHRLAPGLTGAELAAFAERVAVDNALTSARVAPGRVLRVPVG